MFCCIPAFVCYAERFYKTCVKIWTETINNCKKILLFIDSMYLDATAS